MRQAFRSSSLVPPGFGVQTAVRDGDKIVVTARSGSGADRMPRFAGTSATDLGGRALAAIRQ